MPAEPEQDLVVVGRVGRPHGVDGAFVVDGGSTDEERLAVGAEILVDGEPATVVLSRRVGGGRRAIKLDHAAPRGAELCVPRDALPPLPEGSYYVADLVGMEVLDENGVPVGFVSDVLPGPANDVLELDTGLLLPLVDACVRQVDLVERRVLLNPGFMG